MRPASSKERSVWLRRRDLHARPSAHEADELLLLHSAIAVSREFLRRAAATSQVRWAPTNSLRRGGAARGAPRNSAATEDRTPISSLARSCLAIGPWPRWWRLTRIELVFSGCKPDALPLSYSPVSFSDDVAEPPVRTCTGTGRLRNGCSATRAAGTTDAVARPARIDIFAPAEGFEPSSFPVTVGRLTVRPR